MKDKNDFVAMVERWAAEGLITPEQAVLLKEDVAKRDGAPGSGGVRAAEIAVYLGSVVVFLALAFLAILNWQELGSAGRILVIAAPTAALFGIGWPLRGAADPRLRRGAQALWLGGGLLGGVVFLVLFHELDFIDWQRQGPTDAHFALAALLGGILSAVACWRLPTRVQSVPVHLWLTVAFVSFLGWLNNMHPAFEPWRSLLIGLAGGGAWLALDAWLAGRNREDLAQVSRLVGAVTALLTPFILIGEAAAVPWQEVVMEVITFVTCVAFIVASLRRQSRIYLYSGAAVLLFFITYLNFEHFAGEVGLPIALFVAGALLIALGLGTARLGRGMAV